MVSPRVRDAIRATRKLYREDGPPWFLGFSGGKDSTAVAAAVVMAARSARKPRKQVSLLYCDTGVEIPAVVSHAKKVLAGIRRLASCAGIPLETKVVRPRLQDRFFVKVIGRGYPPPTNKFRWCTDRLRTGPLQSAIRRAGVGHAIVLLGSRWAESAERGRTLERHRGNGRYFFKQSGNSLATVFAPLAELSTEEVWDFLHASDVQDVLRVADLYRLYQSASGNDRSSGDGGTAGAVDARFGCWSCTVVRRDRAVESMVADGHGELRPLLSFRNWLAARRDCPSFRYRRRRDGSPGPGPLTLKARRLALARLSQAQAQTHWLLIGTQEERLIRRLWRLDSTCDSGTG